MITGFTLINADTDRPVAGFDPMPAGTVINLKKTGANLTIRANVTGAGVKGVRFNLDNGKVTHTERVPPYALFGDNNGNYNAGVALRKTGAHQLNAVILTGAKGNEAGAGAGVSFTIINQ